MIAAQWIGIFGGTFDPIHLGHLNVAQTLIEKLPFAQIQFIPCGTPPHRQAPIASAENRLQMIQLAIEHQPKFSVNDIEIKTNTTSYTIETLKALRRELPQQTLCLIMANDAFAKFNTWHEWEKILNFCHIIVVNRPEYPLPEADWMRSLLQQHLAHNIEELNSSPRGKIFIQPIKDMLISATDLRALLAQENYTAAAGKLPKQVLQFIEGNRLYKK